MTLKSTETLRPSLITHPVSFWRFMIVTKWYNSLLIQTQVYMESAKSTVDPWMISMIFWFWSVDVLQGKDEAMGRCTCPPIVKLNPATPLIPKLLWFPVTMKGRNAGEVLVAAELLLKDKVVLILICHVKLYLFISSYCWHVILTTPQLSFVYPLCCSLLTSGKWR